ncbi:hypothetical protein ACTL6P_04780 [Endozoicomonas acroporae]|uniref:hypothetical protein n=1 Tax=Endozoicomonas acroporae TaxID=1701104 RepID=UPI000C76E447|nr:hypothetical protein [Endozoicomonas acroporae]
MKTETIDKLFLELSQVTTATTEKELSLQKLMKQAFMAGYEVGRSPLKNKVSIDDEWLRFVRWHELENIALSTEA